MSFGYFRSEILGALFSILIIWLLTGILVYLAIMRIITRDFEIEPLPMVITAACGVVFNIIMFIVLDTNVCFSGLKHHGHSHSDTTGDSVEHGHSHSNDDHGHSHSNGDHGHSHAIETSYQNNQQQPVVIDCPPTASDKKEKEKKHKGNINLRAAAIHVIGDFIQSVGVLIAAIVIYIKVIFQINSWRLIIFIDTNYNVF